MPDSRVRTRVLLTRSPLTKIFPLSSTQIVLLLFTFQTKFKKWSVRLACLIHAASVHPGPGSNPHKKVIEYKILNNWILE